jgi:hypothetical protein
MLNQLADSVWRKVILMPENPYAISYGRHAATAPTATNHAAPNRAVPNPAVPNLAVPNPLAPHPAVPLPATPSNPVTPDSMARDLVTPSAPARPAAAAVPRAAGAARRTPYSHGRRIFYGLVWAGWTALLAIAGFAALFGGQVLVGLFALAAAGVAGHYDYRIWTWRARRLLFLIIW